MICWQLLRLWVFWGCWKSLVPLLPNWSWWWSLWFMFDWFCPHKAYLFNFSVLMWRLTVTAAKENFEIETKHVFISEKKTCSWASSAAKENFINIETKHVFIWEKTCSWVSSQPPASLLPGWLNSCLQLCCSWVFFSFSFVFLSFFLFVFVFPAAVLLLSVHI